MFPNRNNEDLLHRTLVKDSREPGHCDCRNSCYTTGAEKCNLQISQLLSKILQMSAQPRLITLTRFMLTPSFGNLVQLTGERHYCIEWKRASVMDALVMIWC